MFFSQEILGAWVAAFLTLAIFSFLYNDNPIYKAAEHLFVGISAAYALVEAFWQYLKPNLLEIANRLEVNTAFNKSYIVVRS